MANGKQYDVAPSLGTQSTPSADGSKFQMGVAVDLVNRKYEYGQVIKYSLAADDFDVSTAVVNTHQFGVSHTTPDVNSCPSQFVQYGDRAVFGPSTVSGSEGFTEPVRLAGSGHLNDSSSTAWTDGVIYSLDRANRYRYQLSDSVSIYGTGRAAGWHMQNLQGQTCGIRKGYISLNHMGRYVQTDASDATLTGFWENNNVGQGIVGIKIKLPIGHSDAQVDYIQGYSTGSLNASAKGPSREFSKYGLIPFRAAESVLSSPGTEADIDYYNDADDTNDTTGVFRYTYKHNDSNFYLGQFTINNTSRTILAADKTEMAILTGFDHPGGEFKDTAQALLTAQNGLSTTDSGSYVSTGIFYQTLTRSLENENDGRFSKLTSGTNYRMGITYRGNMTNRSIESASNSYAFFQWSPGIHHGDTNTFTDFYMSTDTLLDGNDSNKKNINTYTTKMVSGYVESANIDLTDGTNYQALGVVQTSKNTTGNSSARFSGVEQMLFIDNMWLEHEGDVSNASGQGYCIIDQNPEQGTLQVNRFQASKPTKITLSDGSRRTMDITGSNQRFLHEISCEFLYLPQKEYDKLQDLSRWQDLGHKLTLHPHLPQVPHCLVGEMEITNVRKSFWDLSRFSITFRFTETD
tara:strand:+ start:6216 stop:8111 length:1896 start_codon:yes stop_codon:yes gene_type:complete